MQVRGGVLFNDDGSVFEGTLDAAAIGAEVTTAAVLSALGAGSAGAGDVLTADGDGGAAFAELPA